MLEKNVTNRYGDADLAEFKAVVETKIEKTKRQLASLEGQLTEAAESKDSEGDWMDGSSTGSDMELLEIMASRQKKHLMDLQNALQRIYNKSYGICIVTKELIDKKRLMAVPTTAKSLAAKLNIKDSEKKPLSVRPQPSNTPKVISRIIRKPAPPTIKPIISEEEEEDLLAFNQEIDLALESFDEEDLD